MKISSVLTIIILFGAQAFADYPYPDPMPPPPHYNYWQKIYSSSEDAHTSEGFEILQQHHPEIFGMMDPDTVSSAGVEVQHFIYRGMHSCSADDPRLKMQSKMYHWCENGAGTPGNPGPNPESETPGNHGNPPPHGGGGGGGVCVGSAGPPPISGEGDPCGWDVPPPPPGVEPVN